MQTWSFLLILINYAKHNFNHMKKLSIITGFVTVVALGLMFSFAPAVHADNDKNEEHEKERKEIKATGSTLEVHISDNGKVLVRGAKVTSVSGSTINATTS